MATNAKNQEASANGADNATATVALTISAIQAEVARDTIAKDLAGKRQGWSQKVHCRCITRMAIRYGLPQAKAKEFCALLIEKGLGGNASQFRQWLEKAAPDGPGLLDKAATAEALAADF